eukprot:TRINITY_DN5912_c0_g1_i1.p1 TRINITY_DN5912_c0_g1~~TRINITY_DN5912_c0_g1_i1.p1  ORF type:complete len:454 (-),score=153.00 TRINITY_DN5912_c0_g1_i1:282-1643(-)
MLRSLSSRVGRAALMPPSAFGRATPRSAVRALAAPAVASSGTPPPHTTRTHHMGGLGVSGEGQWMGRGLWGARSFGTSKSASGFDFYEGESDAEEMEELTDWRNRHKKVMKGVGRDAETRNEFESLQWLEKLYSEREATGEWKGMRDADEEAARLLGMSAEEARKGEWGAEDEEAMERLEEREDADYERELEELLKGVPEEEQGGKVDAAARHFYRSLSAEERREMLAHEQLGEEQLTPDYDHRFKDPRPSAHFSPTSHVKPGEEFRAAEVASGIPHIPTLTNEYNFHKVLRVGRHAKPTKGGRVFSFSVLILMGNGAGAVGIGYGKALTIPVAMRKARRDADRNMVAIDRVFDRTISHMVKVKFRRSFVMLKPGPEGHGLRCSNLVRQVCKAAGIKDITAKTHGSRVTHVLLRAILKGLQRSVHPEVKARQLGLKTFDHCRIWRQHEIFKQY